jgi:hypothetical protein
MLIAGFNPPKFIGGPGGVGTFFIRTFNQSDTAVKKGAQTIVSHAFDTVLFAQMIAKIAHGYANWIIGIGNFKPYLLAFIRREFGENEQYPDCYDFVGGNPSRFTPTEPDELHQLGHELVSYNGKTLVLVSVRLFANLGAPLFWAVAGES